MMSEVWMKRLVVRGAAVVAVLNMAVISCGDPVEPVLIPLPDEAETVELTDFVSGSLLYPSGFDLISRNVIRTDQATGWDFVFSVDDAGVPILTSRAAFTDDTEFGPGLQVLVAAFDDVTVAPADGYIFLDPIPISVDDVVVVRSRQNLSFGRLNCRYYGKFNVDEINVTEGTLLLSHLVNPNCENRNLDPSQDP